MGGPGEVETGWAGTSTIDINSRLDLSLKPKKGEPNGSPFFLDFLIFSKIIQ
jgi:hypothetical protein